MGMGMTPKSMSIGLGLSGCPSNDQLSTSTNTKKSTSNKQPSGGSSSSSTITLNGGGGGFGGGKKMSKIALCDMKPVSISGETDSDESLYHELVFGNGLRNKGLLLGKNGTTKSSKLNAGSGCANGGLSYSSLAIGNSSVGSSCTSTAKTESDSGYGSSSQQLTRKHSNGGGNGVGGISIAGINGGSRKIKYQKVNHGGDFGGKDSSIEIELQNATRTSV
jgi:hypothetical protein